MELAKNYNPSEVEGKWYQYWIDHKLFASKPDGRQPSCGFSRKDFLAKAYIAFKECAETIYWLELLHETEYLTDYEFNSIYNEAVELSKILSSITKTVKETPNS